MRLVVVTMLGALALSACAAERHEVAYTDIFDAQAQEATDRGWVPEWLPEQATDIRELHAGDSGRSLLTARWPSDTDLPDDCVSVDVPPSPPLEVDWFPPDVLSFGPASVCSDDSYVIVADGHLYRWTVPTS